jgi:Tfp pilus assembly protein PilO
MISLKHNLRYVVMLLIALVAIPGAWAWYKKSYEPTKVETAVAEARRERLQRSTQNARRVANIGLGNIDELQRHIEAFNQQAMYVARFVPIDTVRESTMDYLSRAASNNAVSVSEVKPLEEGSELTYVTRGFSLRVKGPYHDVGGFLTEILSLGRITQIRDVNFEAAEITAASGDKQWGVDATLKLLTFSTPSRPLEGLGDDLIGPEDPAAAVDPSIPPVTP